MAIGRSFHESLQKALRGLEIGADDFIGKPFREEELFQKIHAHLGVDYVYEAEGAVAEPEAEAELTPESLAGLPPILVDQMREAVVQADLDGLLDERPAR